MAGEESPDVRERRWIRWLPVLGSALLIILLPVPPGITEASWRLFAVFVATMVGLIVQPLPGGAMVLLGVCTLAATAIVP
ncbi:MAG TPA: anion permease, partial [Longimicrobiales bacterium]|nr:anion permease [Longimicrobiales bacterium]